MYKHRESNLLKSGKGVHIYLEKDWKFHKHLNSPGKDIIYTNTYILHKKVAEYIYSYLNRVDILNHFMCLFFLMADQQESALFHLRFCVI